jgi:hypothetical protein
MFIESTLLVRSIDSRPSPMGLHRTLVNGFLRDARKAAPDTVVEGVATPDTAGQIEYLEKELDEINKQLRGWDVTSVSAEGTSSTSTRASSLMGQANALEKAIDLATAGQTRMGGTIVIPVIS